jgi:hypothetical protein
MISIKKLARISEREKRINQIERASIGQLDLKVAKFHPIHIILAKKCIKSCCKNNKIKTKKH